MVMRIACYITGFTIIFFCVKTLRPPDDLSILMRQIAPTVEQYSSRQNQPVEEEDKQLKSTFSLT